MSRQLFEALTMMPNIWKIFTFAASIVTCIYAVNSTSIRNSEIECPHYIGKYRFTSDILEYWNANDPDIPLKWRDDQIARFNWKNSTEMVTADLYKSCELPFKIYNITELDAVTTLWSDEYLSKKFEQSNNKKQFQVIHSNTSHFMFYRPLKKTISGTDSPSLFKAPTDIVKDMTFNEWISLAIKADKNKISRDSDHWYFQCGVPPPWTKSFSFISEDLKFFSAKTANYWVPVPRKNKGIQCRFGMRGVQAASHFDRGRNFVAMIRGQKRYILHPPSECANLGIIGDRKHPSFRHSVWDWGDKETVNGQLGTARALETVVEEGEILYIPSYWFHFIVSIGTSIQCNTRHGPPDDEVGLVDLHGCVDVRLGLS